MKLLILTDKTERPSYRQRIGIYLTQFENAGINCEIVKLPENIFAKIKLFKRARHFDGVFLQKKFMGFFDGVYLRSNSKKIIYDLDDATMFSRKKSNRNKLSHLIPFRRTIKLADLAIMGNSYLAELAGKFTNKVKILPTGLDTKSYLLAEKSTIDKKIRLVWIGTRSTLGYLAEIKPALEEIGKRFDNVVLRIICDNFFDLQNMVVEKCQWSLETQVANLSGCEIGLAPLPDNRFTRGKCGFKILQYSAAGLPVVASPVGVNSDYIKDNITGFLATNHKEYVSRIIQLIENPQLRQNMGKEGRKFAKNFDINVIGQELLNAIKICLNNP